MAEESKSEKKAGGGKGLLVGVALAAAAAAGGAGWYLSQPHGSAAAPGSSHSEGGHGESHGGSPTGQAQYVALDPAFVVNLADEVEGRYLQVEVQLMSREDKAQDTLGHYAPLLRNRLLMLFGQQRSEQLRTREDKERLQAQALEEVRKALKEETGRPVVEALYFTSFVMQ